MNWCRCANISRQDSCIVNTRITPGCETWLTRQFTPRVMERMRERIHVLVDKLLDTVAPKRRMDVIDNFAFPLPAPVVSEMSEIPPSDRDQFQKWASGIISFQGIARARTADVLYAQRCVHVAREYCGELFAHHRHESGDDHISGLVVVEEQGDKLSDVELMTTCVTLLVGGHETTTTLISNGLLLLLKFPDQMQKLKNDPALIPGAVEEMLRYESPAGRGFRLVTKDPEIGGQPIRQGQMLLLMICAANRDPEYFPDPDRFDVTRSAASRCLWGRHPLLPEGAAGTSRSRDRVRETAEAFPGYET